MTTDELVLRFKEFGNAEFEPIAKRLQFLCNNYYVWVTAIVDVSRDEFESEYRVVLFRALRRFDATKATGDKDRFERYFGSCLRKRVLTMRREAKRQRRKQTVTLDPSRHDSEDHDSDAIVESFEIMDLLQASLPSRIDRAIVLNKMFGNTISHFCHRHGINPYEYRYRMAKLRSNEKLRQALSSLQ